MKPESRSRLLEAYDEAFRILGHHNFTSGIKYICLELQRTIRQLKMGRTRAGLEAIFAREPEPSADQLDAIVKAVELLPFQLRKATRDAAKALPQNPGGRPLAFTAQEQKSICAEIGTLIGQGVKLSDAVIRLANRHNVGEITIMRTWQKRASFFSN